MRSFTKNFGRIFQASAQWCPGMSSDIFDTIISIWNTKIKGNRKQPYPSTTSAMRLLVSLVSQREDSASPLRHVRSMNMHYSLVNATSQITQNNARNLFSCIYTTLGLTSQKNVYRTMFSTDIYLLVNRSSGGWQQRNYQTQKAQKFISWHAGCDCLQGLLASRH